MALCVLTGDIVGSTDLPRSRQERVLGLVETAFQSLSRHEDDKLDFYRGDGWQMRFQAAGSGLQYALFIRAVLKSEDDAFDTRVAVADTASGSPGLKAWDANAEASGRALDSMPSDVLFAHAAGGPLHAASLLADHISRHWTAAQARATRPFLAPGVRVTQRQVAETLGITRQAVGQALEAAGYGPLSRALKALEAQAQ
ncbi:MarR family transcriptional regulator [Rhodobacteraceae bacterium 63075]|nr:MarR family transcriptional regulator [Rhodobacteraceae bacterium 63075]